MKDFRASVHREGPEIRAIVLLSPPDKSLTSKAWAGSIWSGAGVTLR